MVTKTGLLSLVIFLTACSTLSPVPSVSRAGLESQWTKPTHDEKFIEHRKINRMTPVLVGDDYVLQGNNINDLVLINRHIPIVEWKRTFEGGVEAGAVYFKGRIYVTTNDSTVQALDAKNGNTIWSFSTSTENTSAPILDTNSGLLYFQNAQNIVFALDAQNGRQVWIYSKPDNSLLTIRGAATPTLHNGVIYVGFSEGSFAALNASNGQLLWENQLNRNKRFKDVDAQAVPYKDMIIVSGYDDKIYALNAKTGQLIWNYPAGSYSAVAIVGSELYASTTDSRIVKLNADTGEVIWTKSGVKGLGTTPVVFKDFLIYGESQGSLQVIDRNKGQKITHFQPGRGIFSEPLFDEKTMSLYFISGEANLHKMRLVLNPTNPFDYIP